MAPSDSQHPEIGVREERRRRRRRRKRWRKQNKTNIEATLHRLGPGFGREGYMVQKRVAEEEAGNRASEEQDFTNTEVTQQRKKKRNESCLFKI